MAVDYMRARMVVIGVKPSVLLFWMLLLCYFDSVSASEDITAVPGEDVILPCRAPNSDPVSAVEWTRGDLESEYVFLYRDDQADTGNQHHSFMNRVELVDNKMKNGNLSLCLKNVTTNDSGTYECHVIRTGRSHGKRSTFNTKPISTIRLDVEGPTAGDTEGGHLRVILPVAALIVLSVLAAVGFVIYKKSKGRFSNQPVNDPEVHQQLQKNENIEGKTISINTSDIQV